MNTTKPQNQDPTGNIYASKTELLEWVNTLLELHLTRLEQVGCNQGPLPVSPAADAS
jgi:hypothetical protein